MRVLALDQFSELGGAQQVLLSALEATRARGWEALVGLPGEGPLHGRVETLGFQTFPLWCGPFSLGKKTLVDSGRFLRQTPVMARQIRAAARAFQPDVLYLNGPRVLPGAALADLKIPSLFHAHSYVPPGLVRALCGRALRRLDASVVGCCRFVAQPWEEFAGKTRVSVIWNGVPGSTHPHRSGDRASPRIGCIGRISPEKGQLEFLAAARLIAATLPHSRFAIYGAPLFSRDADRYAGRVREAASGLHVEFAGWTEDVYAALAELDLLLVPSTGPEGTTRVIPEAFAAGVPVVAFRVGGIPEVIDDGRTGLLADSVEQMAESALTLFTGDPERHDALSQAARESWCARFTRERFQQELPAALEAVARSSR